MTAANLEAKHARFLLLQPMSCPADADQSSAPLSTQHSATSSAVAILHYLSTGGEREPCPLGGWPEGAEETDVLGIHKDV